MDTKHDDSQEAMSLKICLFWVSMLDFRCIMMYTWTRKAPPEWTGQYYVRSKNTPPCSAIAPLIPMGRLGFKSRLLDKLSNKKSVKNWTQRNGDTVDGRNLAPVNM